MRQFSLRDLALAVGVGSCLLAANARPRVVPSRLGGVDTVYGWPFAVLQYFGTPHENPAELLPWDAPLLTHDIHYMGTCGNIVVGVLAIAAACAVSRKCWPPGKGEIENESGSDVER